MFELDDENLDSGMRICSKCKRVNTHRTNSTCDGTWLEGLPKMCDYKLFLDDLRRPSDVGFTDSDWILAQTYDEAVEYVQTLGVPKYISFDHDLGLKSLSGMDFAKWLVDNDLNNTLEIPKNFSFNVHSANVCGATNIESYLENYLLCKKP